MSEAIVRVSKGLHDPQAAHERIRSFYNWKDVTKRTEQVYDFVLAAEEKSLWTRIKRYVCYLDFTSTSSGETLTVILYAEPIIWAYLPVQFMLLFLLWIFSFSICSNGSFREKT